MPRTFSVRELPENVVFATDVFSDFCVSGLTGAEDTFNTSVFRIRPFLPEPSSVVRSIFCSRAIRRTAGLASTRPGMAMGGS